MTGVIIILCLETNQLKFKSNLEKQKFMVILYEKEPGLLIKYTIRKMKSMRNRGKIYIHTYIYICVCIYIYIYIYLEHKETSANTV